MTRRRAWRTLLIVSAVVLIVIAWIFRSTFNFHIVSIEQIIEFVEQARANRWLAIIFYLFFAVGVMALPITLFPIVGGVLLPFSLALPLNIVAATAGAFFSFSVTRSFGRKYVEPILRKNGKLWQKVAEARGFQTVLLLRLIGIPPFIVSNYALGLSRVNSSDFLIATAIGILPWMGIVTYLSHSLWEAVLVGGRDGLGKAMWHALAPLFFVSCAIAVTMLTVHGMKRRRHSNL